MSQRQTTVPMETKQKYSGLFSIVWVFLVNHRNILRLIAIVQSAVEQGNPLLVGQSWRQTQMYF